MLLTEPVSKYIDFFSFFVPSLPADAQDTTEVLNKVKQLENIWTDTFLATMDFESLNTTIEHRAEKFFQD